MQTLEFQIVWLVGAASAGDQDARQALSNVYSSLVAECSWDLELLRSGIVKNNRIDIRDGFNKLNAVDKLEGESCTRAIIRSLSESQKSFAGRVIAASAMTLPKDKLAKLARTIADALDSMPATKDDENLDNVPLP